MNEVKLLNNKVFCIGWHKTGTSTMGDALITLGYNVVGARLDLAMPLLEGNIDLVLSEAEKFDAFQDVPWAALYKELDRRFPDSKFILTLRDDEKWLNSAIKHFGKNDVKRPMFTWLYGTPSIKGYEDQFLERYQRHNLDVKEYFKNRSNDLLIMDFEAGDGWTKLCSFLKKTLPSKPFPHSNKGKHNFTLRENLLDKVRNLIPPIFRKGFFLLKIKMLTPFGYKNPQNRFNNRLQNLEHRKRN